MANDPARGVPGRAQWVDHRMPSRRRASLRRNGAASVHGIEQSVLEPQLERADGESTDGHLSVRDESLRGLEITRMVRRVDHHAVRAGAEHHCPAVGSAAEKRTCLTAGMIAVASSASAKQGSGGFQMDGPTMNAPLRPDVSAPVGDIAAETIKAEARSLSFYYGSGVQALKQVNMSLAEHKVTALIGPSGCGKSTLLRCFNRMHDLYAGNRYEGEIILHPDGVNMLGAKVDPIEMRMRVSMVFQRPNPFPKSIYENVAYGLRVRGVNRKGLIDDQVERALTDAALWREVKDRLQDQAYNLSGG